MVSNVLLLRAPTQDGSSPDKYEACFASAGYQAVSIPVLETVLVNLSDLNQIVKKGPLQKGLGGVIVTSARACEAWRVVVEQLVTDEGQSLDTDWTSAPFYAVGEATAAALADISSIPASHHLSPRDIRGGSTTGTSEKLAQFILADIGHDTKTTLLYLTGDKNRDTLPNMLEDGGIDLENLQVYGTTGSSRFERDLRDALEGLPTDNPRWWIVYFAPSAAEFVTPILKRYYRLPELDVEGNINAQDVHLAAIGPTTLTFLRDSLRLVVDVTAPKPTPEALVGAIGGAS
ncbi:hypothetical protein EUX98_g8288 [Antrodiella citrinella]|uniref:Tetrapyrrole biosynthesis uroporphyrinogen III synthase domain-containing protein n=1 Tax=Antrodiella citrinella TaxID=2447956 RepID=A0A4S4MAE3_9APHY|nr:hypothetical protein EUX98_g8288 [Antrodiella citrinella]